MNEERDPLFSDIIKFSFIALLIVLPIRLFVAQPFIVKGASMEPTFNDGEYLVVDQLSYRFNEPERDEVVILRYPRDPSVFFIKRIIALPGETLEIIGRRVIVRTAEGKTITLNEGFLDPARVKDEYFSITLGPEEYFVMGDNRRESSDSRSWGALPREDIIGRPVARLLPIAHAAMFPGAIDEHDIINNEDTP
jgi:signal peptidase I